MTSTYGEIELSKSGPYARGTDGPRQSPYLQDLCLYVGASLPYQRASEMLEKLSGVPVSPSTIQRLCIGYGELVGERELDEFTDGTEPPAVLVAGVDGSMVHTDGGWHEAKLGRIISEGVDGRGVMDDITVRLRGDLSRFQEDFGHKLSIVAPNGSGLVFVSDGAVWIREWMTRDYPLATQILDWYHAAERLFDFYDAHGQAMGREWLQYMEELLWKGEAQFAIETLRSLKLREEAARAHRDSLVGYYTNNLFRMDYPKYRKNGWPIGSGAIESAHKTAIQQRLKLSGQRWKTRGAQSILCLRTCMLNGNWNYIHNIIQECSAA